MRSLQGALFASLALFGVWAEGGEDEPPKSTADQRQAFAEKAAGDYRFVLDGRGQGNVVLHGGPLLRWNNKVVREDDGMLFLWNAGKQRRPVASAQFFLVETDWHHEFQSLWPGRFEAHWQGTNDGSWNWRPTRPGLRWVRADRIDAPAQSANQRLRQMKSIAERFTASMDEEGTFENPEQLWLLTTLLYRYAARDQGVLDGAIFVFAQGTNFEILMLIEADVSSPSAQSWRYGFARMSCFWLRVHRSGQEVWSADRESVPTPDPGSPYFSVSSPSATAPPNSMSLPEAMPRNDCGRDSHTSST